MTAHPPYSVSPSTSVSSAVPAAAAPAPSVSASGPGDAPGAGPGTGSGTGTRTGADGRVGASLAEGISHPGAAAVFRRLDAALTRLEAATAAAAGREAERRSAVAALQARLDQVIGRLVSVLEE